MAGNAWWEGLKKCYPELSRQKNKKLGTNRAQALNGTVTSSYFDYLRSLLGELNLKDAPDRIWNPNETGLRIEHNPVKVICEKGVKMLLVKPLTTEQILLLWHVVMQQENLFHLL